MEKLLKISKFFFVVTLFLVPVYTAFAQLPSFPCPPGLACSGNLGSINGLVFTIIEWLLGFAFSLAVLFLIIGGFMYITSGGNEENAEKGKNTVVNAIIGIVIIILSYVIISIVYNTLSSGGGGTSPTGSATTPASP